MAIGFNFGARPPLGTPRKDTRKYYGIPGTNIGPAPPGQPFVPANRAYVNLKPGKTTAELESEGNYGQGRMAYETRVNQRKQNVSLRRRAKYMDRMRQMGRQPRKYRNDRLGGLDSAISRNYGDGYGSRQVRNALGVA